MTQTLGIVHGYTRMDDTGKIVRSDAVEEAVAMRSYWPVGVLDNKIIRNATSTQEANHYMAWGKNRRSVDYETIYYIKVNDEWLPIAASALTVHTVKDLRLLDADHGQLFDHLCSDQYGILCPRCAMGSLRMPLYPAEAMGVVEWRDPFKPGTFWWCMSPSGHGCGTVYEIKEVLA